MQECKYCQGQGWLFPWQTNQYNAGQPVRCNSCAGVGLQPFIAESLAGASIDQLKENDFIFCSWYRGDDLPKWAHNEWCQVVKVKKVRVFVMSVIGKADPKFFNTTPACIEKIARFEDPQVALEHYIDQAAAMTLKAEKAGQQANLEVIKAGDAVRGALAYLLTDPKVRTDLIQARLIKRFIDRVGSVIEPQQSQVQRFILGDPDALKATYLTSTQPDYLIARLPETEVQKLIEDFGR